MWGKGLGWPHRDSVCVCVFVCVCVCVCVFVWDADLSRGFNPPDETQKDDKPGQSQTAQDGETDLSKGSNTLRDVQHIVSERQKHTLLDIIDNIDI